MSKKIEQYSRYTTEAAWAYATKKLESVSFDDPKNPLLRKMMAKKIKVVVKIFEVEE